MADIFLSHVEEDASVALEIAVRLEAAGYTTWCYEVDSVPGPSYLLQTGQAIEQAKVLLLLISSHSLNSRQVTQEVIQAHERNKSFLPILRDVTHEEFQQRQPEWRAVVGTATSMLLPANGVRAIVPRLLGGMAALGLLPSALPNEARMRTMRQTLSDLAQGRTTSHQSHRPTEQHPAVQRPAPPPVSTPRHPGASSASGQKRWGLLLVMATIVGGLVGGAVFLSQQLNAPAKPSMASHSATNPAPRPIAPSSASASAPVAREVPAKPLVTTQHDPELQTAGSGKIHGSMRLTVGGPALSGYWRIYKAEGYELGERQQVVYSSDTQFTLPAGRYVVEATYGVTTKQEEVELHAGEIKSLDMVLNAGQLRGVMKLTPTGPVVSGYWRIYKAEGYDLGERQQVIYSSDTQFTLPTGRYVVEATYELAVKHEEVEIRPGETKTLEAILNAGQLRGTIKLTPEGPAVTGYWRIYKAEGYDLGERQQVTYSSEEQFILPAGRYVVEAERGEAKGRTEVTVRTGEINRIEVILDTAS